MAKIRRPIIIIDEEKCDGCGVCVPACAEGALQIIEGKARLISEIYCDGLGACLGKCPKGAISIEDHLATEFDKKAANIQAKNKEMGSEAEIGSCPSVLMALFNKPAKSQQTDSKLPNPSALYYWPVQLALVPPSASFLHKADVLLVADCVPFAYANFHRDLVMGRPLLAACPKLDNYDAHRSKLAEIFNQSGPASLTVIKMEVPCCNALVQMAKQAMKDAGKEIPIQEITVGTNGKVL